MSIANLILSCNSWNDFQNALMQLNNKEKGNAFELLTKLYFKLNPVYAFYEEVWLLHEVPSQIIEQIGIPAHDLGIDLIAKYGEEYHAIQCKFHTETNSSVTFKEVATFISLLEGNKKFTQGYICSSANITSRNFEKIETKPITSLLADTWQSLDVSFFDNARKYLQKKKVTLKPFTPKAHQTNALIEAKKYFIDANNARGKLIFPCGAGKSLTGFWLTQALNSKATLIAVPSLSLVKQTLDVYLREIVANNKKVKWLCICSDEGIGKEEDIVFKTENLGVPCQTNPDYIQNWLAENKSENIIIFTTYQSGRIIAEVSKALDFTFDVAIFDEAHKTVGSNKKLFSHLLFEENIAISKRIFMTATERFYVGSKDEIISMDDTDIYGDIFTQMSFKEAIDLELLTDYKVITIDVKKSEIAEFIKSNNLLQLNDKWKNETEARSLASMLALRKAMKLFPIKNAVSFHSSIEKATRNKELQNYITDTYHYSPIDTFTVSGKMPTTKRNLIVNEFANSSQALITNARCLTEGVDVPNIDCIVFSDPRKSKVDIVQALGRALRKKEGKDWGYVILPVVYDDITQEIDNENFNEILAIVRGLASNDDRIIEFFKSKNETTPRAKKENTSQFNLEVFSDYMDANDLANQLQIKLWEKLSRFEWMPFEEAREFVRGLGLKSQNEWKIYKTNNKSINIPLNCYRTYILNWISWGDWLGTNSISGQNREYMPYIQAQEFLKKFNITSKKEFNTLRKNEQIPNTIPAHPWVVYKNQGYTNFPDFIGYRSHLQEWVDFETAKKYIAKFNFKSFSEFKKKWEENAFEINIPKNPRSIYKNKGFISIPYFLGYQSLIQDWKTWEEAIQITHPLKLKSAAEFRAYIKINPIRGIHSSPESLYKNIWVEKGSWSGFLGKTISFQEKAKHRLSFEKAKSFVHSLKFKTGDEWKEYAKSKDFPIFLPSAPQITYSEWISVEDWIGPTYLKRNERSSPKYLTFEEAKKIVQSQKFKNWDEFKSWSERPMNIPLNPHKLYEKEYLGRRDWLGLEPYFAKEKNLLDYYEASKVLKFNNIVSSSQFRKLIKSEKLPANIPLNPSKHYDEIWDSQGGWSGFLGTKNTSSKYKNYISFSEIKEIIKPLSISSKDKYALFVREKNFKILDKDLPSAPNVIYKSEWKGWADFLGKE